MDLKEKPEQLISIMGTDGLRRVMTVKNLIFIERIKNSSNCAVYYRLPNSDFRSFETRLPLADFEEILPNQFVKANRSAIINTRHVLGYNNCEVKIMVGENIQYMPLTYPIGHKFIEL